MNGEVKLIKLGFVNVFLVRAGDGFILVDTGVPKYWSQLEDELLQAGCLPDRLKLVIVTHGDFDHTGNCAELQRKYGAKIAMHNGDVEMVKTGVLVKRKIRGIVGRMLIWFGSRMMGEFDRFQPDVLLQDREVISGYGLTANIIHTPGHTKGSIALLTADGQLFIGDTLTNRRKPGYSPFIEDEEKLHRSLDALKRVDAKVVYPGHGKPFPFEGLLAIK
jgi:hydroxyacylglutathione hydrolase